MIESLETAVIKWAEDRGIFEKATPASQWEKTHEEVLELIEGIVKNDRREIEDAIGDTVVTLIIQARMHGLSLGQCLASAYDQIKNRTGKMINGVFVKDAP
ncbi:nucleotidepyrophosphohydrolase protein [Pseudomonas phage LUZ100]|uniref:Nucleotidepyrophosphohydrolase protein n=1 Tax=Pseudomonas phage LUZ100 TaxID=2973522 RepID=A0A9Y1DI47_9CAUD|nr:nucleotidepyrophosphohydrolase protein [Pseudomonas phage LUZ100]